MGNVAVAVGILTFETVDRSAASTLFANEYIFDSEIKLIQYRNIFNTAVVGELFTPDDSPATAKVGQAAKSNGGRVRRLRKQPS
jgi:hypothetical protein